MFFNVFNNRQKENHSISTFFCYFLTNKWLFGPLFHAMFDSCSHSRRSVSLVCPLQCSYLNSTNYMNNYCVTNDSKITVQVGTKIQYFVRSGVILQFTLLSTPHRILQQLCVSRHNMCMNEWLLKIYWNILMIIITS